MNESTQEILQNTPAIGSGHTPNTSVATHVSYKLSGLFLVEIERLIKQNSELNLASWRALRGLATFDISSQKDLVKYANLDQGQMSRALTNLEKKGLVSSQRSEEDRRSWHFSITDEGKAYHETLSPIIDSFHDTLTEALTDAELETFVRLNAKIAKAIIKNREENQE